MWSIIKKENLVHFFNRYPELDKDQNLFLLHNTGDNYFLPKLFYKNYPSNHIEIFNPPYEAKNAFFKFEKELRPVQIKIMQEISKVYKRDGALTGIIKAAPGAGKTISAIYIASKLKYRTLIIVDSDNLFKQWMKEIISVTDLVPEQIGKIKQKLFPINDEPIVIATIQTLMSKFKKEPKELYQKLKDLGFGTVIFDEVHNTNASEQYAKVSTVISSINTIGLSATPYKYGGQGILMENVIGPIIYNGSDYNLIPKLNFVYYYSKLDKYKDVLNRVRDYTAKKAMYNKYICSSENYLNMFPKFVKEDLDNNHKIIIICWTEKQIKAISEKLKEKNIKHIEFYGKSRTFTKEDNVLVATYQFAGTGFDNPGLSSLIYACPLSGKVSLIQTAGRILRAHDNKTAPIVRYLVDLTFPTQSLPEAARTKKIFAEEFDNSIEMTEITIGVN